MWNKLSEIEDHGYSSTNDRFQSGVISIFRCVARRRSFQTVALELLDAMIKAFDRYFSRETKNEKAFQWHLFNNRDRQLKKASRNWECYRNRPAYQIFSNSKTGYKNKQQLTLKTMEIHWSTYREWIAPLGQTIKKDVRRVWYKFTPAGKYTHRKKQMKWKPDSKLPSRDKIADKVYSIPNLVAINTFRVWRVRKRK